MPGAGVIPDMNHIGRQKSGSIPWSLCVVGPRTIGGVNTWCCGWGGPKSITRTECHRHVHNLKTLQEELLFVFIKLHIPKCRPFSHVRHALLQCFGQAHAVHACSPQIRITRLQPQTFGAEPGLTGSPCTDTLMSCLLRRHPYVRN